MATVAKKPRRVYYPSDSDEVVRIAHAHLAREQAARKAARAEAVHLRAENRRLRAVIARVQRAVEE